MVDNEIRHRYTIFICPSCGDQAQYAGFCDNYEIHGAITPRLGVYSCIPVEKILEARDEIISKRSPVANLIIETFVERLIRSEVPED